MNRVFKLVVAGAVMAGVALSFSPIGATPSEAPAPILEDPPADAPAVTPEPFDAKARFNKTCGKCHGKDGKADTKYANKLKEKGATIPDLTSSTTSADKVLEIITDGVKGTKMKSYKKRFSAEELKALSDYTMKFRS